MKVHIHLAEGFEEIEALAVADVLRRAHVDVYLVSVTGDSFVKGAHDITVKADLLFDDIDYDNSDMIILPGGMPGTTNLYEHQGLKDRILEFDKQNKWIGAICAAPGVILGGLEIFKGRRATSYPGFDKKMPDASYSEDKVVKDGNIITSRGPGTAILFALEIVKNLVGEKEAENLEKSMIVSL